MMNKYLLISAVLISFLTRVAHAQEIVNGSFELVKENNMPRNWIIEDGQGQFNIAISTEKVHSGSYALKIDGSKAIKGTKKAALGANTYGSLSAVKINTIEVTAWINTANKADSAVALFIQDLKGEKIIRSFVKVSRSAGWQKQTLIYKIDADHPWYGFYYGIEVTGNTIAWCDDMRIKVNGKEIKDPSSLYEEPDHSAVNWLDHNLSELKSTDTGVSDKDLLPIGNLIAEAKVVGVGEPTHGTSEATKFRIRMLEYLVKQKGFTTIALEEVIPTCDKMNDLLSDRVSSIRDSLLKLPFYKLWKTKEMLDLFSWINRYNQDHERKIKLIGIDMEDIKTITSRNMLRQYGRLHNGLILKQTLVIDQDIDSLLRLSYKGMENGNTMKMAVQLKEDLKLLNDAIDAQSGKFKDREELFRLHSYVRVCEQWLESRFYAGKRDQYMAENLECYLNQHPGEKIMLWAHNFHIANASVGEEKAMGAYLKEKLSGSYFPVAITAASGKFMAAQDYTQKKWLAYKMESAYKGTYEYVLNKAKPGFYFLGLSDLAVNDKKTSWLSRPMKHLDLGYLYTKDEDDYKYYGNLRSGFDGVVFFRETTSSSSLL